jgi:hypothetical protein
VFPELGGPSGTRRPASLVGRVIAAIIAVAALVVGFVFSVFLLAVAVVGGLALFGWLWWKMRRALKQARQDPRFQAFGQRGNTPPPAGNGDVIEGEVIRGEWKDRNPKP